MTVRIMDGIARFTPDRAGERVFARALGTDGRPLGAGTIEGSYRCGDVLYRYAVRLDTGRSVQVVPDALVDAPNVVGFAAPPAPPGPPRVTCRLPDIVA